MYEFTPAVIAIYALALVGLFFVELLMFWAGCAIGDQEPPSWGTSLAVVLPVFGLTVLLFELISRAETVLPQMGYRVDIQAMLDYFGIGLIPFAMAVSTLIGWLVALIVYIPVVTRFSFFKGFWVASSEVVFRSVVVLLVAAVTLVFGATYQVNVAKPKPESAATTKPD